MMSVKRYSTRGRVAALLVAVGLTAFLMRGDNDGAPVLVDIPQGATSQQISSILEERGIIRNSSIFYAYVRLLSLIHISEPTRPY